MPRHSNNENSGEDTDYTTDTEVEYGGDTDLCERLSSESGVSSIAINDTMKKQQNMCRFTGMMFGQGMYEPIVVARKTSEPLAENNHCIVISVLENMRSSTGLNWRHFVRLLQTIGKEADM